MYACVFGRVRVCVVVCVNKGEKESKTVYLWSSDVDVLL